MKRFLAFTLVMSCILTCAVIPASAMSFSDLFADHWAYGDVQALVSDGTVKGYEDGTFRPNGTVTRAEFVKMLGNGPTRYDGSYSDVTSSHWAYEYIMSSGMPKDNTNTFRPDEPITRGVVVELLWNRYRSEVNSFVPSLITYQYLPNPEAVAWAYTTSLIQGDDGVNLRLDDSLSRAEAAAVIMRARKTDRKIVTFDEMLKPAILENVFNGLALFDDMTYDPQRTITNGEMARAALRLGTEKTDLVYSMVIPPVDFEHPYAKDLAVICTSSLSKDRLTKAYADKAANFGDAVAALTYQFIAKSTDSNYGAMTEGLPASVSPIMNVCLTYAKNNGFISLKEDLDAPITLGEFTKLCMIVDSKLGSQTDIATEIHSVLQLHGDKSFPSFNGATLRRLPCHVEKHALCRIFHSLPKYSWNT